MSSALTRMPLTSELDEIRGERRGHALRLVRRVIGEPERAVLRSSAPTSSAQCSYRLNTACHPPRRGNGSGALERRDPEECSMRSPCRHWSVSS
jgi:hypothetical protein